MVELKQEDLRKVLEALPLPVTRMLRMSGLFLAGGFIRAVVAEEKPSDIDIFSSSKEEAERWSSILASSLGKGRHSTPNAITISHPGGAIQFITRWLFSLSSDVIKSFDFTIAQAVVFYSKDAGAWLGYASDEFYPDTNGKILRYTSPTREEDAAGSLLRVNKFLSRGYSISDEDLAKVVARVGEAARLEKDKEVIAAVEERGSDWSISLDPVEPYRRVIKAARPSGGGSV